MLESRKNQVTMEGRKWEELPRDCLVDIFGRVGLESLLLDIPFVCKSWHQAFLNPLCWKQLPFPSLSCYMLDYFSLRFQSQYGPMGKFGCMKLVKGVVDRSAGCVTYVELPSCYGAQELSYVADKCPALKTLVVESDDHTTMSTLSSVMGKFKNLEVLRLRNGFHFRDIVTQVGVHCQNITALGLDTDGMFEAASIGEDEVMTIVSCLPKLKSLTLKKVKLEQVNLIKLLNGCEALVYLDVSGCRGFDEDDEEVLKLASYIPTFKSIGSVGSVVKLKSINYFGYFDHYIDHYDDNFHFGIYSDNDSYSD